MTPAGQKREEGGDFLLVYNAAAAAAADPQAIRFRSSSWLGCCDESVQRLYYLRAVFSLEIPTEFAKNSIRIFPNYTA